MAAFASYKDAYPNAQLVRSDSGVLEIAFHTSGGKLETAVVPSAVQSMMVDYDRSVVHCEVVHTFSAAHGA